MNVRMSFLLSDDPAVLAAAAHGVLSSFLPHRQDNSGFTSSAFRLLSSMAMLVLSRTAFPPRGSHPFGAMGMVARSTFKANSTSPFFGSRCLTSISTLGRTPAGVSKIAAVALLPRRALRVTGRNDAPPPPRTSSPPPISRSKAVTVTVATRRSSVSAAGTLPLKLTLPFSAPPPTRSALPANSPGQSTATVAVPVAVLWATTKTVWGPQVRGRNFTLFTYASLARIWGMSSASNASPPCCGSPS